MVVIFIVLIVLICILMTLIILVQNPKGGGLGAGFGGGGGSLGGGVQQTTDFLEKTTWGLVIALFVLSIVVNAYIANTHTTADPQREIPELNLPTE